MYKLIAIDMDGTLLRRDNTISERTKRSINSTIKKGVKVVLASGRPIEGLTRYLDELNLSGHDDYVMSFNGSLIQNVQTKKIIFKRTLTGAHLKELYAISKKINVNIHAFTTKGCITPKMSEYTAYEGHINGIEVHIVDFDKIPDNEVVIKVMFVDPEEKLEKAMRMLPEYVYEDYTVVRSAPFFLEFLNKEASKGLGIKALGHYLGINQEEIICIGDANNDLDMIQFAGLGVAMGNAFKSVKEVADFITSDNDEDGVALVIEKFIGVS